MWVPRGGTEEKDKSCGVEEEEEYEEHCDLFANGVDLVLFQRDPVED